MSMQVDGAAYTWGDVKKNNVLSKKMDGGGVCGYMKNNNVPMRWVGGDMGGAVFVSLHSRAKKKPRRRRSTEH